MLRADHKLIQQTESKGVVPMKILEHRHDGLYAVFAQQQAGDCLIRVLPMLERVERPERMLVIQHIKEIQHRRNRVL